MVLHHLGGGCSSTSGAADSVWDHADPAFGTRRSTDGQPRGSPTSYALILLMSIVNWCDVNLEDAFRIKEARNETRAWA